MKWLEIIELQASSNRQKDLVEVLELLIADFNQNPESSGVTESHSYSIDSDFSIHVEHRSSEPIYVGSQLGLQAAGNLKSYGLSNHHIWYQIDKTYKKENKIKS